MNEARLPRTGIHEKHEWDKTGADRCRRFVEDHASVQAARVKPALWAMHRERQRITQNRVDRWRAWNPDKEMSVAPGHIQAMAGETGVRA